MYARWLSSDYWQNRNSDDTEIQNPTWDQVENALYLLDGKHRTLVTLSPDRDSECFVMISGQWDGKCGVNATKNNWDFFSLTDSTRSANKQIVFMGGQNSEFPERNLVPMDWAMQAAKLFFETGEFKKSLNWIHDRSGVSLAESEGNK